MDRMSRNYLVEACFRDKSFILPEAWDTFLDKGGWDFQGGGH